MVKFVIKESGHSVDIAIAKGKTRELDAEALRVVHMLPDFKPGYLSGKLVRIAFMLPITFRLNSWPQPSK